MYAKSYKAKVTNEFADTSLLSDLCLCLFLIKFIAQVRKIKLMIYSI